MYENVLLPTDGSESIEQVLDHTIEIAADREATVHVLYVVDDRAFLTLDEEMKAEVIENLQAEGERATDRVADELDAAGIDTQTTILRGTPADVIVAYVDDADIDLVTMGTQAAEYEKNMLGSTSQKVVTRSTAPVLTVDISQ